MNGATSSPRAGDGIRGRGGGLAFTLTGILLFAPDGLLLRLMALDSVTATAWRATLAGAVLTAGSLLVLRRRYFMVIAGGGLAGLAVALLQAGALGALGFAIELTSVATVLVGFALSPVIAALLSLVVLGERLWRGTWIAICAAGAGTAVIGSGAFLSGSALGFALSIVNATLLAGYYVAVRKLDSGTAVPFVGLGFLVLGAGFWLLLPVATVEGRSLALLLVNGSAQLPLAIAFITLGARLLPAAEVAMLSLSQTILGTAIVWTVIGEVPTAATLAGGAAIILTLLIHEYLLSRRARVSNKDSVSF